MTMPSYDLFNSPIMQAAWQNPVNAEFLRGTVQAGGAPQLQEAVAEEQAQTNFNRDMTNAALMSEMANRGAYVANPNQQSPALTQGLMPGLGESTAPTQQEQPQQRATLNQLAKVYADQIVQAKGMYGEAERQGNAEAMDYAHNAAEQARANLAQLGVDPAAYGLNGTYEEAQQAMNRNNLQAMQNVLNGNMSQSSIGHYDDTYNYLINQGYSQDIAAEVAGQKARTYAIQRIRTLEDAFNMYGHDGKVINPMGVQLLQKLAEEEPDMATYYTQRYAGPLQEYAKATQRENAAIQHQYKSEDRAADQQNRLQAMGYQAQLNAQLKAVQARLDSASKAQDFQYRVMLLDRQAQLKALTGGGNGSSGNNVNSAQIKVWQEEVKRADEWDEKHIGQEKDNPYRASANAYKAMIDRSQGLGQESSSAWAEYGDVPNDFNAFGKWVDAMFEKNRQDGYPRTNEQIIAIAEGVNKQFADNYIDDSYRKPVKGESTTPQVQPRTVVIPPNEVTDDYALENEPRGSWGNVFDVSSIIQNMRNNPQDTEAGRMAMRRYR